MERVESRRRGIALKRRSWRSWSAFSAGAGLAFLLSAALVEQQPLTLRNKFWISMLGAVCIVACIATTRHSRRSGKGHD